MLIGNGKNGVSIGEYGQDGKCEGRNDGNEILGWIEPRGKKKSWIIWFTKKGDAIIYTKRETSGGVIGEPITIKNQ